MMIDSIYKYSFIFEKKAIAKFPPLMAEEISKWVKNKYLSSLSETGEHKYAELFIVNTKHLSMSIDPGIFKQLPVELLISDKPPNEITGGQFIIDRFAINMQISRRGNKDWNLEIIDVIIEHELAHMLQFLIMYNKQKKEYNDYKELPGNFHRWYRNFSTSGASDQDNVNYLINTELQPYLLSAVREFILRVQLSKTNKYPESQYITVPITVEDFNIFVGNPEPINNGKLTTYTIFKKLYEYNFEQWKKAVKLFWKAVEPYIDK